MIFAHMADCHIGGWRDPRMRVLTETAFSMAVDICIEKHVDFVLISGDLFNSSVPELSVLKNVVKKLKLVHTRNIPVYAVTGSHDYSPSGKTIIDVLEEAGLLINVVKGKVEDKKLKLRFTVDKKTGVKITGMLGKRGMLEKHYYESLDYPSLESETGFKIFMFHTALTELKPKNLDRMDSSPISLLPKGFDYYAGGHIHIVRKTDIEGYKNIVYPGPLFPNTFKELEDLNTGGFYIFDNTNGTEITDYVPIHTKDVFSIKIDANHSTPEQVYSRIVETIKNREFRDTIVLIRIEGTLESGKPNDIDFNVLYKMLFDKSAYYVMRNTYSLKSKEFEEIIVKEDNIDEIENSLISEHLSKITVKDWTPEKESQIIKSLMHILHQEKKDGEKVYDYEDRIVDEASKVLDADL